MFTAHFQNGAISKENAASMDTCLAIDINRESGARQVALAISNNNVYDGYIGEGFPTELTKTFIGIRKKDSNEVLHRLGLHLINIYVYDNSQ